MACQNLARELLGRLRGPANKGELPLESAFSFAYKAPDLKMKTRF